MTGTYCINCNSSPCKCQGYSITLCDIEPKLTLVPSNLIPDLVVTEATPGCFECCINGASGSPVVGRGKSVLEAVGNWAIYSQAVHVVCDPPELLEKFGAWQVVGYMKAPERG